MISLNYTYTCVNLFTIISTFYAARCAQLKVIYENDPVRKVSKYQRDNQKP
jgi:hypothetical protein